MRYRDLEHYDISRTLHNGYPYGYTPCEPMEYEDEEIEDEESEDDDE